MKNCFFITARSTIARKMPQKFKIFAFLLMLQSAVTADDFSSDAVEEGQFLRNFFFFLCSFFVKFLRIFNFYDQFWWIMTWNSKKFKFFYPQLEISRLIFTINLIICSFDDQNLTIFHLWSEKSKIKSTRHQFCIKSC